MKSLPPPENTCIVRYRCRRDTSHSTDHKPITTPRFATSLASDSHNERFEMRSPSSPALASITLGSLGLDIARGQEEHVHRVLDAPIDAETFLLFQKAASTIGVTDELQRIVGEFDTPEGETPAGFRIVPILEHDGHVAVDLRRDISFDRNGRKRPTDLLFSADSANPYEVDHIAPFIANLTCNPGIIYDLFINNPDANIDNRFTTRDEVMAELGRILGPGCDISVELNNPFAPMEEVLDEAARFKDLLGQDRVVIKVPHTGPVNANNYSQLLTDDGALDSRWDSPSTEDALRGHNIALRLHEEGYRVNFTLMFEPYQAQMALQARPAFINSFIRHRLIQSTTISGLLKNFDETEDREHLVRLRDFMWKNDYLSKHERDADPYSVVETARRIVKYRQIDDGEGQDGLDGVRHNLRVLRGANLDDTRLIVCSMEGPDNYPDLDKLFVEPEFQDMRGRIVLTAEPNYIARFTSTNQVTSYQRRFMKAAEGQD